MESNEHTDPTRRVLVPRLRPEADAHRALRLVMAGLPEQGAHLSTTPGTRVEAGAELLLADGALLLDAEYWLTGFGRNYDTGKSYPMHRVRVAVHVADAGVDGGLRELWHRDFAQAKSASGSAVAKQLAKWLAKYPAPAGDAQIIGPGQSRPNFKRGACRWCGGEVREKDGALVGWGPGAELEHTPCPPRPVETGEVCEDCERPVVAHQAHRVMVREGEGRWAVRHRGMGMAPCSESPRPTPQEWEAAQQREQAQAEKRRAAEQQRAKQRAKKAAAKAAKEAAVREFAAESERRVAVHGVVAVVATEQLYDKGLRPCGERMRLTEERLRLGDGSEVTRYQVTAYGGAGTVSQSGAGGTYYLLADARAEYKEYEWSPEISRPAPAPVPARTGDDAVLGALMARRSPDAPAAGGGSGEGQWTVDCGVPGPRRARPGGSVYEVGQVMRAELREWQHPVPADAPGYRGGAIPSAIVTVTSPLAPQWCEDEDGNQPSCLIGEDGWWHRARVRIATREEAAPLLAEEAEKRRVRELRAATDALFLRAADGEVPAEGDIDLSGAVRVPYGEELHHGADAPHQIHVDEGAGVVWVLRYNGRDGDTWAWSNHGPYIARRLPLTGERSQLIARLRAEYAVPTMMRVAGIGRDAARVLLERGIDADTAQDSLGYLRLEDEPDVLAWLARPLDQWRSEGWVTSVLNGDPRWPVAQAATLADAGVTGRRAAAHHRAGRTTADQVLAAAVPQLPTGPARILLRASGTGYVTSSPELAAAYIAARPQYWGPDAVTVVEGIHPVHVHDRLDKPWSYWSDGSLVTAPWLRVRSTDGSRPRTAPMPSGLSEAAVTALDLVATSARHGVDRPLWQPLAQATAHTQRELERIEKRHETIVLLHHRFALPDDRVGELWQILREGAAMAGGEGEEWERSDLYPSAPTARAAWTTTR
ncbi:hypothetical protein [Streptomyces sp. G-5]|uniref:hypothetical protein n=1 Tax=Streptomyces sp. G-5 TaxID=2977231 RepID=UPI0021CFDD52|nr:hypothetical protein [Streptomyces sp. G-5]MCU4750232.1 hypothetical protein [Streptomyces sp. G-5]